MADVALEKSNISRDVNDNHVHEKADDMDTPHDDAEDSEKYRRVELVVPEPKRLAPPDVTRKSDFETSDALKKERYGPGECFPPGLGHGLPNPQLSTWQFPFPFFPGMPGYPFLQHPDLRSYTLPFLPERFQLRQPTVDHSHQTFPAYPSIFYDAIKRFESQAVLAKDGSNFRYPGDHLKADGDASGAAVKSTHGNTSQAIFLDSVSSPIEKKKRKDLEPSKYQCSDCNKSYSTFSGLSKHKQFHCNLDSKKEFTCKYCDKTYVSLGALKMHIRTHTLPCKCKICGKAFSRPWLLQGHVRTHTGEKPFTCVHCLRAFADRSNLRAHLQTHSEVKKYSCKTCSKTFSRMSLLLKHEDSCSRTGAIV